ncbi:transposase [Bradyrhizobium sp. USDA 4501]
MITSVERRRWWSRDEKERLVAASLEPGATVSEEARMASVHGETSVAPFVPVEIGPSVPARDVAEARSTTAAARRMEAPAPRRQARRPEAA